MSLLSNGPISERSALQLSEPYEPCEGTWDEFKADIKTYFARLKAEWKDHADNAAEAWHTFVHRNHASA